MRYTLDPLQFPLHGVRLIEASAGTGKTYTIANLYLRLLLGHGSSNSQGESTSHHSTLNVDQILVVTFTEAATGELRDRIRARIHDARIDFIAGKSKDTFIQSLLSELDHHEHCIQLLRDAEQQMDEAAIFTIHGFCQRMLKQHAFESGTLFSSELITDEQPLFKACVSDFWRHTLYPLDKTYISLIKMLWSTPDQLLIDIRPWINKSTLSIRSEGLPTTLDQFYNKYVKPILAIKTLWFKDKDAIRQLLTSGRLKSRSKILTKLPAMEAFIQSDELIPEEGWPLYSTGMIKKALKKGHVFPDHSVFEKIDQLLEHPIPLQSAFRGMILKQALTYIKEKTQQQKAIHHQLSFDDLLVNLSSALEGKHGVALADAIRKKYRVAMIDEFQDTDPQQYAIFSKIYIETSDSNTGLFMIGDPKQAIYAFRGADIFTYMYVRNQVKAHYTLDTNWRSSAHMIAGVNRIFTHSLSPFIYDNDISFYPIQASEKGKEKSITIYEKYLPAIQIWLQRGVEKPTVGSGEYQDTMATATATEINRLLTLADQQQCLINDGNTCRSLQAGDIAILVRTGRQGQLIRDRLAQQGIASVYLSNSGSVFSCQEAYDIQKLLFACLNPTNERALRAALATLLFGLDAAYLDQLNLDEQLWEQVVEEFSNYQTIWFNQGILPMLRSVIRQRKIAETLLTNASGERQLTDVLHLGELLAIQAMTLDSHHALYRWLTEAIDQPNKNALEQQLHLESEQDLVKIVTIHKAKGLEYNIVFLPFICRFREEKQPIYHDEHNHCAVLDLEGHGETQKFVEKERLAEDLRLLYVALTRSVYSCYIGIAPLKTGNSKAEDTDLNRSGIGWLLNNNKIITASRLPDIINNLVDGQSEFSVTPPPIATLDRYQPPIEKQPMLKALSFTGYIERNWWITSYSALSKHSIREKWLLQVNTNTALSDASMETAGYDVDFRRDSAEPTNQPLKEGDPYSIFNFPKGARPGTFLHSLFERVDFNTDCHATLDLFVREQLLLEGYDNQWTETLVCMLKTCLQTPLDGVSLLLGKLPEHQRKVEMEFYLPIKKLNARSLNQLITTHDPISEQAGLLNFQQLQGMLKGFIDLSFEYNGQWYVLDYKSNWLGSSIEHYSRDQMTAAMISHRYDLQYQLYSLALHRLLKQRIPNYDYDKHFGGVIYLFLRGITPSDPERHGIFDCRPKKQLIECMDQLFSGQLDIP
ncbi:MAG: exodeoxyribonuclease V subunit beta [Endozoicomonas sp. (ex Botrylloides leachii)]|nr:exodeoxyribonuclease V subunit beta [Endozoicomonas sp. (ex Botrylloides leachii)]